MLRRFFLVFALVAMTLLASCASSKPESKIPKKSVNNPTFTLILDKGFGGPERDILLDSFKQWERDTHGTVKFTLAKHTYDADLEEIPELKDGCTYDVYVIRVPGIAAEVRKLDAREGAKTLGFTRSTCKQRIVVMITDRLKDSKTFRQVAVHEAGHLVGLDHIPVPNESVMFPSVDKALNCPATLDMKQLCMLYECDWRDMVVCDSSSSK